MTCSEERAASALRPCEPKKDQSFIDHGAIMAFIVVDHTGTMIAGACTSPDVAGLVALLEEDGASVRTIALAPVLCRTPAGRRRHRLPLGWGVVATHTKEHDTKAHDTAAHSQGVIDDDAAR